MAWDAKYRSDGRYPREVKQETLERWKPEIADAIACMPEGAAKVAAADAFLKSRVEARIFGGGPATPQQAPAGMSTPQQTKP